MPHAEGRIFYIQAEVAMTGLIPMSFVATPQSQTQTSDVTSWPKVMLYRQSNLSPQLFASGMAAGTAIQRALSARDDSVAAAGD